MNTQSTFVRYQPGIEQTGEDEQKYIDDIVATQRSISEILGEKYRHGVRSVHTKSHGVLAGTFDVFSGIPEPYAQGLFAKPGTYDAIVRLSTNPGDLLPDSVSAPRGFALKVVGIQGEPMLDGHSGDTTQDFLLINGPVLGAPGPKEFATQMKLFKDHLDDPDQLKEGISAAARGLTSIFALFGGKPNPQVASLGGQPGTNLLGETFNTQLAARHGKYVAKYNLAPETDNLKALKDTKIDLSDPDALRDSIQAFFAAEGGTWLFGVQLCTDLEKMPIEDGATPWSEDESPFVPVARLTLAPQPSYTPERRVYADDFLTFSPWNGLQAHQPLGAHNRARKAAYAMSTDYRHEQNVRRKSEPKSGDEFFKVA